MSSTKRPSSYPGPSPKRSAWQQPASCEFCRVKKIRCDKQRPCSSCTTRDIQCEYALGAESNLASADHAIPSLQQTVHEMNERLKRVEDLLLHNSVSASSCNMGSISSDESWKSKHDIPDTSNSRTWDQLEEIAASPHPDGGAGFRTLSTSVIVQPNSTELTPCNFETVVFNQFPPIDLARFLFDNYIQAADCFHREIHIPSAWSLVETTYDQVAQSMQPSLGTAIFLLSIFASGAYYVDPDNQEMQTSTEQTSNWKETALGIMMTPNEILSTSTISMQSALIMLYLLWDSEGQSKRFHALKGVAHTKAMQMKLHKLDANPETEDRDPLDSEIRRRLWWHLACTDWLIASVAGPQEGIYSIHPKQMTVNYPSNVDDDDLRPGQPLPIPHSSDQPTQMSFFLQRIRVAQLCREAMDCLSAHPSSTSARHPIVCNISDQFAALLQSLPWFFNPDQAYQARTTALSTGRPYIAQQRNALLYGIYSRLGRLHRPFLLRGLTDPTFAVSHQVGIDCAEKLLDLRQNTIAENACPFFSSHSVDQHSFNALLLLTIDGMARPGLAEAEARRVKVTETCRALKAKYEASSRTDNGIPRAVERLLEILQDKVQVSSTIEKLCGGIGSESADMNNETVPVNSGNELRTARVSSLHVPNDDITNLLHELSNAVPNSSYLSWEDFFDWQGMSG